LRTARALALVLIVIVSALLLAELFYATPNLFYRGSVIVRAYAIGSYGLLVWLTNASFSVWAWAPTPNGTEFMPIYNGTGFQAVIGLRKLASWAEDWVHAYGKVAIGVFEPSIIIWVSYYIRLPNGSVELVAQPFYRPLNLSLPLSGILGMVVNAVMGRPFITVVKASGANARGSGDTLAFPPPFYVVPHVIAWYPNDTGMAPISLAVALAQPSSASGGVADVEISTEGFPAIVDSVTLSGSEFEAALRVAESGNLLQAVRTLSPVMGPALDFTSILSIGTVAYILLQNEKGPDISQLYIVGQGALVNWTEVSAFGRPVTWYLSLQPTEARIAKFKPTKFVSYTGLGLYYWWGYDKCVNLSEWAREQQVLMQNSSYFFGTGMNSTCPLPNTPAPVIWQDYDTNMTYYTSVNPNMQQQYSYVDLSVNGGESLLGIGIDAGSAIASIIGTALMASQPEVGAAVLVIAALLGSFQYQYHSVAASVNSFFVDNTYTSQYVNVYYSGLTPVYYNASGYGFTLPRGLVLINVSSSP
jgi:hypothetical protein